MKLITDIDMVLMIEKGIRGGICHVISRYAKVNNKYMKLYKKDKELSCLMSSWFVWMGNISEIAGKHFLNG